MLLFHAFFRDPRMIQHLLKQCEGIHSHSDMVMIKIRPKGIYIMFTDAESFACGEVRVTERLPKDLVNISEREFTAKVFLDDFIRILRIIVRTKHVMMLTSTAPETLTVHEMVGTSTTVQIFPVKSAEKRERVFWVLSSHRFMKAYPSQVLMCKFVHGELNRLVSQLAVISGHHGGVCQMKVWPEGQRGCAWSWSVTNATGTRATFTIHMDQDTEDVCLLRRPQEPFECVIFLKYVKNCQQIISNPSEQSKLIVTPQGLLIVTDTKQHMYTIIHVVDISQEDLESFC